MYPGLATGIAIIVIIIVIVLLILIAIRPWINNNVPVGGACNNVNRCRPGLICESGVCKVPIGGSCRRVSDCVTPAIACFENRCIAEPPIGPTGPNGITEAADISVPTSTITVVAGPTGIIAPTTLTTPAVPVGTGINEPVIPIGPAGSFISCGINNRCPPGYVCQGSIVIRNGQKEYQFTDRKVLDVTGFMDMILVLLDNGDIVKDTGHTLLTTNNSVNLDRIFVAGGILYGINNGNLYWMVTERPSRRKWEWEKLNWSPRGITHASASLNGEWLWLQSNSKYQDAPTGYLYKTPRLKPPKTTGSVMLSGDKFRVYGIDNRSYLEINPSQGKGISFINSQSKVIPGMVDGALMSDDTIIMVDRVQTVRLWSVRVIPQLRPQARPKSRRKQMSPLDAVYEIENKLCEKLLL